MSAKTQSQHLPRLDCRLMVFRVGAISVLSFPCPAKPSASVSWKGAFRVRVV